MSNPTKTTRFESLDVLRGLAMILILVFHSSIYNFANLHKIDFDNPPIVVIIMSFMALWGGMFIIYSMTVNTIMLLRRSQLGVNFQTFQYLITAGIIYIALHYVLTIFLGRWSNDFVNNQPDMTVVASSLRSMNLTFPHPTKYFEGSSLSTVAFNLIILSVLVFLLLRNNGLTKELRNYLVLGISGFITMTLSFIRVPISPFFTQSIEANNYLLSTLLSFVIANPYPLLPYLGYGIFGVMLGMMIFYNRVRLLKIVVLPIGLFFLTYGLWGVLNFEKTISQPDYFWYFKTHFELGLFLLLFVLAVLVLEPKSRLLSKLSILKWFSRISLTIYLLETTTSEIFRIALLSVWPSWNQTINGCLAFGGLNVFLWIIVLTMWRKIDFKYSLEYFWVLFFNKLGKRSTKIDVAP